jgi:hypothetical protein
MNCTTQALEVSGVVRHVGRAEGIKLDQKGGQMRLYDSYHLTPSIMIVIGLGTKRSTSINLK